MNTRARSDFDAPVTYGQPTAEQVLHLIWSAGIAQCRAWGLSWAGVAEQYAATGNTHLEESTAATAVWFHNVAEVAQASGVKGLLERSDASR